MVADVLIKKDFAVGLMQLTLMPMDKTVGIDLQRIDPLEADVHKLLFVFNLLFIQQIFAIFFYGNQTQWFSGNNIEYIALIWFASIAQILPQQTNQPVCASFSYPKMQTM